MVAIRVWSAHYTAGLAIPLYPLSVNVVNIRRWLNPTKLCFDARFLVGFLLAAFSEWSHGEKKKICHGHYFTHTHLTNCPIWQSWPSMPPCRCLGRYTVEPSMTHIFPWTYRSIGYHVHHSSSAQGRDLIGYTLTSSLLHL